MAEDKVKVSIDGDSSGFNKAADQAQSKIGKLLSSVGGLKTVMVGAFTAIGVAVGSLIKGSIQSAAALQDTRVQFEVLTGSVEQANIALQQLQTFSASTPFQFEDVANAGRILLSFGFAADDLTNKLQKIGDVAAASGSELKEIALIYGQVSAAGKLTGERLLQLQERGINIGPALAKSLGVGEKAVRDLVSKGKVDFEVFEKAFASLSEEGGFAFSGLDKQSKTLNGSISTMKDNWEIVSQNLGSLFLPVAVKTVEALTAIAQAVNSLISAESAQDIAGGLVDQISLRQENIKALEKEMAASKEGSFARKIAASSIELERKEIVKLNEELDKIAKSQLKVKKEDTPEQAAAKKAQLESERAFQLEKGNLIDSFAQQRTINEQTSEEERLAIMLQNQETEKALKEVARADELAAKGQFEEASAVITELAEQRKIEALRKSVDASQKAAALKKQAAESELATYQSTFAQISTLQQSSNKAFIAIGKAAALANIIISTNVGAAKALELGPIVGPPLAAAIYAAGAVNAANVAGVKGFADGGVIGGISGATAGKDNQMATVRTGEMILNAEQQEGLFNAISTGQLGGGSDIRISFDAGRFADAFEAEIVKRRKLGVSKI